MIYLYFFVCLINPCELLQIVEKDNTSSNKKQNETEMFYNVINIFEKSNISELNSVKNKSSQSGGAVKLEDNVQTEDNISAFSMRHQDKRKKKCRSRARNKSLSKIPGSIDKLRISEVNSDYSPENNLIFQKLKSLYNKTARSLVEKWFRAAIYTDVLSDRNKLLSVRTLKHVEHKSKKNFPKMVPGAILTSKILSSNDVEEDLRSSLIYRQSDKGFSLKHKPQKETKFTMLKAKPKTTKSNEGYLESEVPSSYLKENNTIITVNNVINEFILIPGIAKEFQTKPPMSPKLVSNTTNEEWIIGNYTNSLSEINSNNANINNSDWIPIDLQMEILLKPEEKNLKRRQVFEKRNIAPYIDMSYKNISSEYYKVPNKYSFSDELNLNTGYSTINEQDNDRNIMITDGKFIAIAKKKRSVNMRNDAFMKNAKPSSRLTKAKLPDGLEEAQLSKKLLSFWREAVSSEGNKKINNRADIRESTENAIVINMENSRQIIKELFPENKHLSDKGFHKYDNNQLQEALFKTVKVLCLIMKYTGNESPSSQFTFNSWGKKCNSWLTISAGRIKSGWDSWTKVRAALKYVHDNHFNEADWILKANENDYVIMENLRYMLADYNTEDPLFFGCRMKLDARNQINSGSYVLSKAALHKLVKYGYGTLCGHIKSTFEDIIMGNCMDNLGIISVDTRDEYNRTRMFPGNFYQAYTYRENPYSKYMEYPIKKGLDCCSDYPISFRDMSRNFFLAELLIYHIRPYGIDYGNEQIPNILAGKEVQRLRAYHDNESQHQPNIKQDNSDEANSVMTGGFYNATKIGDLLENKDDTSNNAPNYALNMLQK